MEQISVSRLGLGSVFKYGYLANFVWLFPFALIVGLNGLAGGSGVTLNGEPVYGVTALITALVLGCLVPVGGALMLLLGTAILRLFKDRAPKLRLGTD